MYGPLGGNECNRMTWYSVQHSANNMYGDNRPFSPRDEEFDSTSGGTHNQAKMASGGTHNQAKMASGGSHDDMNEIKFKA